MFLCQKLLSAIGIITNSLNEVYLEYCSFIWSPYQISYIEKIEGIQRYFTRRVLKHVGLPYMERLSVLKLESLEVRRIRADLKLCFKIIYGLCDLDTGDFFTLFPPSSVTRGHSKKLIGARCNTNWQLNFFSNRVVNVWELLAIRHSGCQIH